MGVRAALGTSIGTELGIVRDISTVLSDVPGIRGDDGSDHETGVSLRTDFGTDRGLGTVVWTGEAFASVLGTGEVQEVSGI